MHTHALHRYRQIGTALAVDEASPHRLVQMLMNHALEKINFARGYMVRNEIAAKGAAIGAGIITLDGDGRQPPSFRASRSNDRDSVRPVAVRAPRRTTR